MPPVEGVERGPFAGQLLDGRYRLESLIAAGGMGEVWRARDELLGRPVAVKLVKDAYAGEAFLARFRSEARTAAALSHPGVAQVFDYGEHDGSPLGRPFLVMELVNGRQLSALLATVGTLPAGVVLDIVGQAARALYAAHRIGITHRDIKPANLLVTDDGRVKITDFGIAAGPGPRAAGTPGTEQRGPRAADREDAGLVLGTPAYMSPEQAKGKPVTPASDIYSLGMVAYQCAAGRLPFTGETPIAIAIAHAEKQPRRLPGAIPAPVRELIMGMIAADPRWRPASAAEVAESASVLLLFTDGPQLADVAASVPAGSGDLLTGRDQRGKTLQQPLVHFRRPADSRNGHRRRAVIAAAVLAASAGGLSAAVAAGNPAPVKHTVSHRPVAVAPTRTPRPTRRSTPPPSKAPLTISVGNTQPAQPVRATSAPAPPPTSSPASPPPPRSPSPSPSATPIDPPTPTPPPTSPSPTSPPPTSPSPTSSPPTSPPPPPNQVGQAILAIG
jgi:serine/threonine-protein kinase